MGIEISTLADLRNTKLFTVTRLASKIKAGPATIVKWENEPEAMSAYDKQRYAEGLDSTYQTVNRLVQKMIKQRGKL